MKRHIRCLLFSVFAGGFTLCLQTAEVEAAACPAVVLEAVRTPAAKAVRPVEIDCDLTLAGDEEITQPIVFAGSAASGTTLDCRGATLNGRQARSRTIIILSRPRTDGDWDVPENITIRNCTIRGDMRIQGLGSNGEAELVRQSSLKPGHTERAQSIAPRRVTLQNLTFVADGTIPLYLAPGVTEVTLRNSRFTGRSASTVVYMDTESARNVIANNTFATDTDWREVLAVDGSAGNRIEGNLFVNPVKGGIFVYRNCGEGGTVRHQAPRGNLISGNTFQYKSALFAKPAVWLGSRGGLSMFNVYCMVQPGMILDGFNHSDGATGNTVTGNRLSGGYPTLVVDDGEGNVVKDNR